MLFSEKRYHVSDPNIKKDYVYCNISDIHSNYKALRILTNRLLEIKPDFIVMAGDIIDSINNHNNKKLAIEIKNLAKYFKIFICYGNHDTMKIYKKRPKDNIDFFNELMNTKNIHIITNNEKVNYSNDIIIKGFNLDNEIWYIKNKESKSMYKDLFFRDYQNDDKFTILLSHSPYPFENKNNVLDEDYVKSIHHLVINSGHNHAGFVPISLQKFFKRRGIFGPHRKVNVINAYGYNSSNDMSLIISDGITKWSDCNGRFIGKLVNKVLYASFDIIKLSNSKKHKLIYEGYENIKRTDRK